MLRALTTFQTCGGRERKYLRPFSINSASFAVLSTYSRLFCLNCTKSCTPIGNFCILFCSFLRLYCPPRYPRLHPCEEATPATLALTCDRAVAVRSNDNTALATVCFTINRTLCGVKRSSVICSFFNIRVINSAP